jgi:hypothetical protein
MSAYRVKALISFSAMHYHELFAKHAFFFFFEAVAVFPKFFLIKKTGLTLAEKSKNQKPMIRNTESNISHLQKCAYFWY